MKTLEEKLLVCNGCANRFKYVSADSVCKLTNSQPKFDDECADFKPAALEVPEERTAYVAPPIINSVSGGIRFANFLIDYVMVIILMFIAIIFLALSGFNVDAIGESQLYSYGVAILVHFIYYTFAEGLTGRTIGKLITGTKVVSDDGTAPSIGQVALRSICRHIPFEPFSFLGSTANGWHDSISATYVVKKNSI